MSDSDEKAFEEWFEQYVNEDSLDGDEFLIAKSTSRQAWHARDGEVEDLQALVRELRVQVEALQGDIKYREQCDLEDWYAENTK